MSSINPQNNNAPKQINRFMYFICEVWGWTKFISYGLVSLIGIVIVATLLISVISFPYYWYIYNTTFTDHISSVFFLVIQLVMDLVNDYLQEFVDFIFGVIALFILIGCIYPFVWLSNFLMGKKSNNTIETQSKNKLYRGLSVAAISIVISLVYFTYYQSQQATVSTKISVTPLQTMVTFTPTIALEDNALECCATIESRIYTGKVIPRSLRIRDAPSINSKLITQVKQNQTIYIHGKSNDEVWLFVEYQNKKFGWASREFIEITLRNGDELPVFDAQSAGDYAIAYP
jgi:hypothetical protein